MDQASANDRLREISFALFGEKAELRIVDPREIKLLRKNARFMGKSSFDQLTNNIKGDGFLSSVPLCVEEKEGLLVLSGNHRVKASIEAGIKGILVIIDKRDLSHGQKIAVQLFHNAISGSDDEAILASLWGEIGNIEEKLYAGLDSKMVEKLENEKYMAFNPAQLPTKQMVFWFLPEEIEHMEAFLASGELIQGDITHVVSVESYSRLVELIIKVKKTMNIKNSALALQRVVEIAEHTFEEDRIAEEV